MSLSPYMMAQRLQRSRDWHLVAEGRARRAGDEREVFLHARAAADCAGYLAEMGFDPRPPWGPSVA